VLHMSNMPWWLTTMGVLIALSQLNAFRQNIYQKLWMQKTVKLLVFFGGMVCIWMTYQTFLGVEAGVTFLLLCLIAKLLEVKGRRDVYVTLTLGLFVIASLFLFDQNIVTTLLVLIGVLASLYSMIAQNDHGDGRIQTLFWLSAQAIPLIVVLFIFFPRLPPLWSVQLNASQAKTGMTDHMSPGDVAQLSQSNELAFRVVFDGASPQKSALYWRGMVLGRFDGKTWRTAQQDELGQTLVWRGGDQPAWVAESLELKNTKKLRYQLIMEPTQQVWLFALNVPYSMDSTVGLTRDFTIRSADPLTKRQTFQLLQLSARRIDTQLPVWLAQENLQLPVSGNPKAKLLAKSLFDKMDQDPVRYSNAVLSWIRTQNFRYTLKPPLLYQDRIDDFLFKTRRGFCEHYASSFVFLMRAAGIPARVVVGYQGGALSRDGQSLEVRQKDAHAWTEVWFAGRGWVLIDPTAAIAPERIEQGMDALTHNAALFGDDVTAQLQYQQFKVLRQWRELADYTSYLWHRDVVGFDQERQQHTLSQWFGLKSFLMQVLWMFGLILICMAFIVLRLWWKRRPVWHPLDQPLMQLSLRLERQGLSKRVDEGMLDWLKRLENVKGYEESAQQLALLYAHARYSPNTDDVLIINQRKIKKMVKEWSIEPRKQQK
jgi:protein-glutamine gamma-glutamyltransferase